MYRQTLRSYLNQKSLADLKSLADSVTWVSTQKIRNLLLSSRAVVVSRPWTASRKQLGEVGRDFLEWKSSEKKKPKHWDLLTIIGITSTPPNNQTQDIGRVECSSITYLRSMYKFQNHKKKKTGNAWFQGGWSVNRNENQIYSKWSLGLQTVYFSNPSREAIGDLSSGWWNSCLGSYSSLHHGAWRTSGRLVAFPVTGILIH